MLHSAGPTISLKHMDASHARSPTTTRLWQESSRNRSTYFLVGSRSERFKVLLVEGYKLVETDDYRYVRVSAASTRIGQLFFLHRNIRPIVDVSYKVCAVKAGRGATWAQRVEGLTRAVKELDDATSELRLDHGRQGCFRALNVGFLLGQGQKRTNIRNNLTAAAALSRFYNNEYIQHLVPQAI
ncbi:hypothetical protein FRC02_000990 [Tulasnella sp. 418]|nr:hypothetical protein FRC02_000990 [Tulasnella sp. 418]